MMRENADGTYFGNDCGFCDGLGMVTKRAREAWDVMSPEMRLLVQTTAAPARD